MSYRLCLCPNHVNELHLRWRLWHSRTGRSLASVWPLTWEPCLLREAAIKAPLPSFSRQLLPLFPLIPPASHSCNLLSWYLSQLVERTHKALFFYLTSFQWLYPTDFNFLWKPRLYVCFFFFQKTMPRELSSSKAAERFRTRLLSTFPWVCFCGKLQSRTSFISIYTPGRGLLIN